MIALTLSLFVCVVFGENVEKRDFCETMSCEDKDPVCGIREEEGGFRLRLFDSACELLQFGCKVEDHLAYGLTSITDCDRAFQNSNPSEDTEGPHQPESTTSTQKECVEFDCSYPNDAKAVCGMKNDGEGFRIRLFENICKLWLFNCENESKFTQTELHICNALDDDLKEEPEEEVKQRNVQKKLKNIVIVDSSTINFNNYNESIENFFAATHVFDLPIQDVDKKLKADTRRRLVKIFGPQKIFKPWTVIPKNITVDIYHLPTLSSCYHKCPVKCPDTYAPVCGVPGVVAREPSIMFQNHCFMDVAQCKMFWEDKSPTSESSSYIESSFLFCLGDELNNLYRFLPLIRTLQRMGRLKKKGHFNYKFKNMKFYNNLLSREPNIMG